MKWCSTSVVITDMQCETLNSIANSLEWLELKTDRAGTGEAGGMNGTIQCIW